MRSRAEYVTFANSSDGFCQHWWNVDGGIISFPTLLPLLPYDCASLAAPNRPISELNCPVWWLTSFLHNKINKRKFDYITSWYFLTDPFSKYSLYVIALHLLLIDLFKTLAQLVIFSVLLHLGIIFSSGMASVSESSLLILLANSWLWSFKKVFKLPYRQYSSITNNSPWN